MKEELKKKFEELGLALLGLDPDEDVLGIHYSTNTKLLEVHVMDGKFPEHSKCYEEYVWRNTKEFPWQKQVTINGVIYFDCITQEQFDREHAKECENNDNQ
jgi:hypothetical protein